MLKSISSGLILLCIVGAASAQSQQRPTTVYPAFSAGLIWSPTEDGSITLSVDKVRVLLKELIVHHRNASRNQLDSLIAERIV